MLHHPSFITRYGANDDETHIDDSNLGVVLFYGGVVRESWLIERQSIWLVGATHSSYVYSCQLVRYATSPA